MECDAHSYPDQCSWSLGHAHELRRLPIGGDGAVITCHTGYLKEMAFRRERNRKLELSCQFDLPSWESLEVYA